MHIGKFDQYLALHAAQAAIISCETRSCGHMLSFCSTVITRSICTDCTVSQTGRNDRLDSFKVCAHHEQENFIVLVVLGGSAAGTIDMDDGCLPTNDFCILMGIIQHDEVFPHRAIMAVIRQLQPPQSLLVSG